MKYKVVRNYNDANKLLQKGYTIKKIDRDRNNRDFLIFLFEDNEKITKDLENLNKPPFIRFTNTYGDYFDKSLKRVSSPIRHKPIFE